MACNPAGPETRCQPRPARAVSATRYDPLHKNFTQLGPAPQTALSTETLASVGHSTLASIPASNSAPLGAQCAGARSNVSNDEPTRAHSNNRAHEPTGTGPMRQSHSSNHTRAPCVDSGRAHRPIASLTALGVDILIGLLAVIAEGNRPNRHFVEGGVITWLNGAQLLVTYALAAATFRLVSNRRDGRDAHAWPLVSLGSLYLAADETLEIHESIGHYAHDRGVPRPPLLTVTAMLFYSSTDCSSSASLGGIEQSCSAIGGAHRY